MISWPEGFQRLSEFWLIRNIPVQKKHREFNGFYHHYLISHLDHINATNSARLGNYLCTLHPRIFIFFPVKAFEKLCCLFSSLYE
jgi:hypothetical protein